MLADSVKRRTHQRLMLLGIRLVTMRLNELVPGVSTSYRTYNDLREQLNSLTAQLASLTLNVEEAKLDVQTNTAYILDGHPICGHTGPSSLSH